MNVYGAGATHDERAGPVIADAVCALNGPGPLTVDGSAALFVPHLLDVGIRVSVVAPGNAAHWLAERHPGVSIIDSAPDQGPVTADAAWLVSGIGDGEGNAADRLSAWLELPTAVLFIALELPVSDALLKQMHDVVCAAGWGLHPRSGWTAGYADALRAFNVSLVVLTRGGLATASPEQHAELQRAQLLAEMIRPADRVRVHVPSDSQLPRILTANARPARLEHLDDSIDNVGDQASLDFVVVDPVKAEASFDDVLSNLTPTLRGGARLALTFTFKDFVRRLPTIAGTLQRHQLFVEACWLQNAQEVPGLVLPRLATTLQLADVTAGLDADFCLLVLGLEYPVPWRETRGDAPNIIAFERDYIDPSLVRQIIAIGLRYESPLQRRRIAKRILADADPRSADAGAALCVLCYDWFADGRADAGRSLMVLAQSYLEGSARNPTCLRWQISLAYVLATMARRLGQRELSMALLARVAGADALQYSPLLGTKVISAAVALGWMVFADGDTDRARKYWQQATLEALRLVNAASLPEVIGSLEAPELFGMPELASVLDEAGRAAAALRIFNERSRPPGMAWQAAGNTWANRVRREFWNRSAELEWARQVQQGKDWLEDQYHRLQVVLAEVSQERDSAVGQLEHLKHDHAGLLAAFELAHRDQLKREGALQDNFHAAKELAALELRESTVQAEARFQEGMKDATARLDLLRESHDGLDTAYRLAFRSYAVDFAGLEAKLTHEQHENAQLRIELERLRNDSEKELGEIHAAVRGLVHHFPSNGAEEGDDESTTEAVRRIAGILDGLKSPRILQFVVTLAGRRSRSKQA